MGPYGTTAVLERPLRERPASGINSAPLRTPSPRAASPGGTGSTFSAALAPSAEDLLRLVELQTGSRIHDIDIDCSGTHVVVTGRCRTWYLKQLVTHAIRSAEPHVRLMNEIVVDDY